MKNVVEAERDMVLFQNYIEVCNRALAANKDRFPFKQILEAAQGRAVSPLVDVCVIDDIAEPKFTLHIERRKIIAEKHGPAETCACEAKWSIRKSYLEDVVNHPEEYIKNPALIDWDWMYAPQNK